jgi:hypothetical protein
MAHATATPTASKSDWYTLLRNAFLNGLKAYGASFMMGAFGPLHLGTGDNNTTSWGAPCLPVLETRETNPTGPKPAACPIHRAVSSRDGWEAMNSALDWTRA